MKIIDLLNKIANGEEVPKKIKIRGWDYKFELDDDGYMEVNEDNSLTDYIYSNEEDLNREVEILEEEKKIPEKIEYYDDSIAWVINDVGQLSDVDKVIIDTLNGVIDYLKAKEKNKI